MHNLTGQAATGVLLAESTWDHMDDGTGVAMMIGMVAVVIAVIVLVVVLVRGGARTKRRRTLLDRDQ